MKNKTVGYKLYDLCISEICRNGRKTVRELRKKTDMEILSICFTQKPYMWETLDSLIMANEYLWRRDGGRVVFPSSHDLWGKLVNARYDRGSLGLLGFAFAFL